MFTPEARHMRYSNVSSSGSFTDFATCNLGVVHADTRFEASFYPLGNRTLRLLVS
ncbi:hypothetical protein A2U01_0071742, partial [Trifolium medium]|nr:hypothetical protein [Trifolium medium]